MCKKEGIEKTYFYHLRDVHNKPVSTVCLLKDSEGMFHRGISICSKKDIPKKAVGRGIAFGRALEAFNTKTTNYEKGMALRYEAIEILDTVADEDLIPFVDQYVVKSVYNAELTQFERKLARV